MKTLKILSIMILGIVIFTSCEKDEEVKPTPDFVIGEKMDKNLTSAADSLAIQMSEGFVTEEITVYDPVTGNPIINPVTGEPETETVQIAITAERQYEIIASMALVENWTLCDEIIEYKNANKQRVLFGFPEEKETKIISRQIESGDVYVEKLSGLNDLSAIADNGMTVTQMIESIFTNAEETVVKSAMEYCREQIIYYQGGGLKSVSAILAVPSDQAIQELIIKQKKSQSR